MELLRALGWRRRQPHLLFYCQGRVDLRAFSRFHDGLRQNGWGMALVTHAPSVWLKAVLIGIPCELANWRTLEPTGERVDVAETYEGRRGWTSPRRARRFEASLWRALDRAVARFGSQAIAQWNGATLGGRVVTAFAKSRSLSTAYLELGNVESKLFVDQDGVSGTSRVARSPALIDVHQVEEAELQDWRRAFISRSREDLAVPQVRLTRQINPLFPLDWIGANLFFLPAPAPVSVRRKLAELTNAYRCARAAKVMPEEPYIFLPLQVSTDANLVLSQWSNEAALAAAGSRARELGVRLAVKPHPAERDPRMLARLQAICRAEGHLWTGANTIALLEGAREVITINSTVGLLAKIMNCPVIVLGDSLYGGFSERQAQVFAYRHLIDLDPFGEAPASVDAVARLLEIMNSSTGGPIPAPTRQKVA